jgi:hypothetical protein
MSKIDWKQKYYELRSKYMNAIDVAFRLGVQEGQKNQKIMDMEMQLQQMQEAAAMGMGGEPGMEGGEELPPGEAEPGMEGGEELPPEDMAAQGDGNELDASIDELEQYVKSEEGKKDYANLLKSFHENKKTTKNESKDTRVKKINSILQKWDENSDAGTQDEYSEITGEE